MAVAAAWQVDTDFLLDEYLKTLHSFTGPRDIQLVVVRVAHFGSLLLLSSDENTF